MEIQNWWKCFSLHTLCLKLVLMNTTEHCRTLSKLEPCNQLNVIEKTNENHSPRNCYPLFDFVLWFSLEEINRGNRLAEIDVVLTLQAIAICL